MLALALFLADNHMLSSRTPDLPGLAICLGRVIICLCASRANTTSDLQVPACVESYSIILLQSLCRISDKVRLVNGQNQHVHGIRQPPWLWCRFPLSLVSFSLIVPIINGPPSSPARQFDNITSVNTQPLRPSYVLGTRFLMLSNTERTTC
jgi:hypothetical protein